MSHFTPNTEHDNCHLDLKHRLKTLDALHAWVRLHCGLNVPRKPVCAHHQAPFEYLRRAYFEPAVDQVVWAPRGGGKTRLAAVATLLDLLHKPGCAVRILGGSLEQSLRLWEHLLPDLRREAACYVADASRGGRRVEVDGGAHAEVLAQSQRAVRGLRVQKLRCDEVEMFDPKVWEAAQLVTRSQGGTAGTVEALSTYHKPWGVMRRVVEAAQNSPAVKVVRWCVLDVLQRCPPERPCDTCPLWDDCGGVAKTKCDGFFAIDDAIRMKRRVSAEAWESEMLCRKPNVTGCVFPHFDPEVHVKEHAGATQPSPLQLAIDFGFASPFVCLWVRDEDGVVHVVDEYVQPMRTVDEHLAHIGGRRWGKVTRVACDPAGAGRNEQTAASNVALLRAAGYTVRTRASRIVDGLELIRRALKPASGEPTLFIHPRCARLIRAMQGYHFAPGGSELPVKDGEFDHPVDALRYYFVNRTTGEIPPPRRY